MKTFTATQLNKKPQEVFAAVKEDGEACIKHDRYKDGFIIYSMSKVARYDNPSLALPMIRNDKDGEYIVMPTAEPQPRPASDQQ